MRFLSVLYLSLVIIVCSSQSVSGQISIGGQPHSFEVQELPSVTSTTVIPVLNIDSILVADSLATIEANTFPLNRYGVPLNVNLGLTNSGQFDILPSGDRIWRLQIACPGALSIDFVYDQFFLSQGAVLHIYNKRRTDVIGGFTLINNNDSNLFATDIVKDDTVIVELFEEAAHIGTSSLNISKVVHGFVPAAFCGSPGAADDCNIDVNCPTGDDWCLEKKAVVCIQMGGWTGSGVMINNSEGDLTPYLLTANHLRTSSGTEPTGWLYRFQYIDPDPDCDGDGDPEEPSNNFSQFGAHFVANNTNSDFLLAKLFVTPPPGMGVHYSGWDIQAFMPQNSGAVLHHAKADLMKISTFNGQAVSVVFDGVEVWRVYFNNGIIEGGSSGAPLYNASHHIIGQVKGTVDPNGISCDNQNGVTYYGRFDESWGAGAGPTERLREHLNPNPPNIADLGPTGIPVYLINRTITGPVPKNFTALNTLNLEGNVSVVALAQNTCPVDNIPFTVAAFTSALFKSQNRVIIRRGVRFPPGSSVRVRTGAINCGSDKLINGDFIDTYCNTNATMKTGGNSYIPPITTVQTAPFLDENENSIQETSQVIKIYPNPTPGQFQLTVGNDQLANVYIYDVLGNLIYNSEVRGTNSETIDISSHGKGIYFVKVIQGKEIFTEKLIHQ